jgi:hypothetical protein
MVSGSEVDITAVVRARDETRQAMTGAKRSSDGLTRSFGSLNKVFGMIGLGGLGVSMAIGTTVKAMQNAARTDANLEYRFKLLPKNLQEAFTALTPMFPELAQKYGVTEKEVADALTTIAEGTQEVADLTTENLSAALGLSKLGFGDVKTAAKLYSDALQGQEEAVRSITGNYASFNDAVKAAIEIGPNAVTAADKMSVGWRNAMEEFGTLLTQLEKGDIAGALKTINDRAEDIAGQEMGLVEKEFFELRTEILAGDASFEDLKELLAAVVDTAGIDGIYDQTHISRKEFEAQKDAWEFVEKMFSGTITLTEIEDIIASAETEEEAFNLANKMWEKVEGSFGGSPNMNATDIMIRRGNTIKLTYDDAYHSIKRALEAAGEQAKTYHRPPPVPTATPSPVEDPRSPEEQLAQWAAPKPFGRDLRDKILKHGKGLFGMAEGGIATSPTAGIFGEAGPEALIPLNRMGDFTGNSSGGNTFNIYGNIDSEARVREMAREVERLLTENKRRGVGI